MRCYQEIGLKKEARDWLEKNAEKVPSQVCPKCKHIISEKENVLTTKRLDLFYGDGPLLRTIRLKDGRNVKEVLQRCPWSSGPMAFFCLEIDKQRLFEWKDKEIEKF